MRMFNVTIHTMQYDETLTELGYDKIKHTTKCSISQEVNNLTITFFIHMKLPHKKASNENCKKFVLTH